MIKEDLKNEFIIGQTQRIILLVSSLFLAVALFFARGGLNLDSPLDSLARSSLPPQQALLNGKPTVFEFYADWCEACKEMAPEIIDAKKNFNKVDFVLLNVDNSRWSDLIDKYNVNGIPQLNFFDNTGQSKGFSLGVRKKSELNEIFIALSNNLELPSFNKLSNSSNLTSENYLKQGDFNNIIKSEGPRNHS